MDAPKAAMAFAPSNMVVFFFPIFSPAIPNVRRDPARTPTTVSPTPFIIFNAIARGIMDAPKAAIAFAASINCVFFFPTFSILLSSPSKIPPKNPPSFPPDFVSVCFFPESNLFFPPSSNSFSFSFNLDSGETKKSFRISLISTNSIQIFSNPLCNI